jgi:ketosteroid isomerase-like protein
VSEENVAAARAMYAAFSDLARGADCSAYVAAHWDADGEYRPVEETATVRGHDALVQWTSRWMEAWQDFSDEIDEVIDVGGPVVAAVTVKGRGRESGMDISQRLFHVIEVRDGKILRLWEYLDREEALQAARLREQAMSRRNSEVVRAAYEAVNGGDLDAAIVDIAPDCEYVASGAVPGAGGNYLGPQGVKLFVSWLWEEFDRPNVEIHELIESGDHVVVWASLRARGKRSGAETEWDTWQLWTLRDGKFVRGQGFTSKTAALEAIGLRG